MPRKPNYRFERAERDRQKAQKKEERLKARAERQAHGTETPDPNAEGGDRAPDESSGG